MQDAWLNVCDNLTCNVNYLDKYVTCTYPVERHQHQDFADDSSPRPLHRHHGVRLTHNQIAMAEAVHVLDLSQGIPLILLGVTIHSFQCVQLVAVFVLDQVNVTEATETNVRVLSA